MYRSSLSCVLTLFLVLLLVVPVAAQPKEDDLLEQQRQRQEIENQRIEQAVKEADRTATQLGKTDPKRAIEILCNGLTLLETADSLPETKKAGLRRQLELSIKAYEGRANDLQRPLPGPVVSDIRRQSEERERQEQAQIAQMLQQVRELRAAGKTFEANRLQDELYRRAPGIPAVGAGGTIAGRNELLADSRRINEAKGNGWLGVMREVDKSSIPEVRDYVLPPDWAEKSKRRSPSMQLTKAERAILEALSKPISTDFDGEKFDEVINFLGKAIGHPIIVPKAAMDEAQITSETPVKLKVDRVSTRTVLRKLLSEVGLAYIIKDGTIQVTTIRGARETLTTRTYYVGDLVAVVDVRFGPVFNQFQMIENVNRILALITQTVDPLSWEVNGGAGKLAFDPLTMSIIVRQTAEIHMMLGVGLR